jgi:predicted MFS family arabinose efflux permease
MRLEWQRLLGSSDRRLAYAFESSAQMAMFVVGPALAGAGIAAVGSRATLGACAVLLALGSCTFGAVAHAPPRTSGSRLASPIRLSGVLTLVLATAFADVALGALDVLITAFADRRGRPDLAGPMLALLAGSSAVGALAYGRRSWRVPVGLQLGAILAAASTATWLLALPASLPALALLLALAGVPSGAHWAATSLALDRASGGHGGAEAYTWLTTANAAGIAAGSVLAGAAVGQWGVATAFLLAATGPAAAATVVVLRRRTLGPLTSSAL